MLYEQSTAEKYIQFIYRYTVYSVYRDQIDDIPTSNILIIDMTAYSKWLDT